MFKLCNKCFLIWSGAIWNRKHETGRRNFEFPMTSEYSLVTSEYSLVASENSLNRSSLISDVDAAQRLDRLEARWWNGLVMSGDVWWWARWWVPVMVESGDGRGRWCLVMSLVMEGSVMSSVMEGSDRCFTQRRSHDMSVEDAPSVRTGCLFKFMKSQE